MHQLPEDSLAVEQIEEAGDSVVVHHKPTVAEVIARLGPNATPQEQDSAVQAAFPVGPLVLHTTRPDTLHLPGLPGVEPHVDLSRINYHCAYFEGNEYLHPEVPYRLPGIAADPYPYRMRSDDYVNAVLLLAFFLGAWVISRSRHFLSQRIKDFFYARDHEREATSSAAPELRGQVFLIFQTCFVLSLLFFNYTQNYLTDVFNRISPYILLGVDVGICVAYYVLKLGLYSVVNATFFEREKNVEWLDTYLLVTLGEGILLLPLALLVVYFDLSFHATAVAFLIVIVLLKILLFYKCLNIFFRRKWGFLHLILYFCTLEIAPLFVLWRAWVYGNECLVVNI